MAMSTEVRRLLALYDAADATNREGARWYGRGRAVVRRLSREYGATEHRTAAVVAALSPRVRWAQNVEYAETMLSFWNTGIWRIGILPNVPVFSANRDKAWRVLLGERPLEVLGGPKVRAFYRNLTGDLSCVTVDVWAARAIGHAPPTDMRRYGLIEGAYIEAARLRDVQPAELQSIVWAHVRGGGA